MLLEGSVSGLMKTVGIIEMMKPKVEPRKEKMMSLKL